MQLFVCKKTSLGKYSVEELTKRICLPVKGNGVVTEKQAKMTDEDLDCTTTVGKSPFSSFFRRIYDDAAEAVESDPNE